MKLVKEIVSKTGEVHFRRWSVFSTPIARLYVHQILKADEDSHLHTHPWHFFSFVFEGSYTELDEHGKVIRRSPGSFAFRKSDRAHKILSLNTKECWTLVLTLGRKREWGYRVGDGFVQHEEYRRAKIEGRLPK